MRNHQDTSPHNPPTLNGNDKYFWKVRGNIVSLQSCNLFGLVANRVCLKMVSTPQPNGFADHYPY